MTTASCGSRKHTPIVSEKQRKLFGAVASGKSTKATGLSRAETVRHLEEAKGKDLPEFHHKHKKGNPEKHDVGF